MYLGLLQPQARIDSRHADDRGNLQHALPANARQDDVVFHEDFLLRLAVSMHSRRAMITDTPS